jgi:hypothetical protein
MNNQPNAWLSDEELIDVENWDDEIFAAEDAPDPSTDSDHIAVPSDQPTSTPLPEYLDDDIAAELAGEMAPVWLGTRWRDIPASDQPAAWNGLRTWVDWLVKEYKLSGAIVPPCWYKHSDIVAELYAAMCMEYKVWEEGEPGVNPMMFWHPNLQQMVHRLREMVSSAGCYTAQEHKEPMVVKGQEPFELNYDEADWQQHVNRTTTTQQFERPERGVLYIRAGIVDPEGTRVTHSAPVGIKHADSSARPAVDIEYLSTNSAYNVLQASWEQYRDDYELVWESSLDGETWEIYEGKNDHFNDSNTH